MENKDFEKLVEMLNTIVQMRKKLGHDILDECDQIDCKIKNFECPIFEELTKDFDDLKKWAFGDCPGGSANELKKVWFQLHPYLPVPRYLKTPIECEHGFLLLYMDIFPLYLDHKKNEKKS